MHKSFLFKSLTVGVAISCLLPAVAQAANDTEVNALRQEVKELKGMVLKQQKVTDIKSYGNSSYKLAGYSSIGYSDQESTDNRFDTIKVAPIFHFRYKDKIFFEAEFEYEVAEDGTTTTALEYAAANIVINDSATFTVGKMLSNIGNFRQNMHPSWINKFASAPVGFGHDQGAPLADIGMKVSGGLNIAGMGTTYSVSVGNGPELKLNGAGNAIEVIETGGFTRDLDGEKLYSARVTALPFKGAEFGISGGYGEVGLANEQTRSYRVFGADFSYQVKGFELRGEVVRQHVGELVSSVAPDKSTWDAAYIQAAYKIPTTKIEGVIRYSDLESPQRAVNQDQVALGVNYLFASNVIAKLGYEINNGVKDTLTDSNKYMLQLAYGF